MLNPRVIKNLEKYKALHKKNYDDIFIIDWKWEQWKIEDKNYNKCKELLKKLEVEGNNLLLKIFEKRNIQKKHNL